MLYRNGKAFRRFIKNSLINNRDTNYRLTAKRLGVFLLALGIYLPAQFLIWSSLVLDEVLFPDYKDVKVKDPVFIIGNPRSGTTFLQRLLARDRDNFITMRTWEIFGAPSISMRGLVRSLVRAGRALGVPIARRIRSIEKIWQDDDKIHRLKLRSPEEDEYLFIHSFTTLKIWSFAAMVNQAQQYIYYDQQIPEEEKNRIMAFYESCLKRHYYYHGQRKKNYLSKNPNFTPAIQTLRERFPGARFIYLIRNPLEAVPSHISLKEREWKMLGSPLKEYACKEFILENSRHWYEYPLEILPTLPRDQRVVVKFEDLVSNAEETVNRIYDRFGLPISQEFSEILEAETYKARNYVSQHHYSLEEMGLTPEDISEYFGDVMREFDYQV